MFIANTLRNWPILVKMANKLAIWKPCPKFSKLGPAFLQARRRPNQGKLEGAFLLIFNIISTLKFVGLIISV